MNDLCHPFSNHGFCFVSNNFNGCHLILPDFGFYRNSNSIIKLKIINYAVKLSFKQIIKPNIQCIQYQITILFVLNFIVCMLGQEPEVWLVAQ